MLPDVDTIVVPAQEDRDPLEIFLDEKRWGPIPMSSRMIPKIKNIALYRSAPKSAITHWAPVSSIVRCPDDLLREWGWDPKKHARRFLVKFAKKVKKIGPIRLVPKGKVKALRNIRYTSLTKLLKAKTLDEVF